MTEIRAQRGKALIWTLVLVAIVAGAIYYFYFMDREDAGIESTPPPLPPVTEPEPPPEPEPEPEEADEPAVPPEGLPEEEAEEADQLPTVADSDEEVMQVAEDLVGQDAARENLVPEGIVPRLVATVESLTKDELPKNIVPVRGPGGDFQATSDGLSQEVNPETGLPEPRYVLDPANFERYTPQVERFEAIDTEALVAQYRTYYPLIQESYRELGYPEGEFEARLLEVIDHLLATPEPARPVHLVKPEAFYKFEDPELEDLSAGQKVLIRMGPSNAARVKAKLREIRRAIQTQRE